MPYPNKYFTKLVGVGNVLAASDILLQTVDVVNTTKPVALPRIALTQVTELIHRSFATVAEDFHLTPANCCYHPAFLPDAEYARQLCSPKVINIGVFTQTAGTPDLIGFVSIHRYKRKRGMWEMKRLCTAPQNRHSGIGGLLVAEAKRQAAEQGAKEVYIDIIEENQVLKRWYIAHGFRETGQEVIEGLPFTIGKMTCGL